MNNLAKLASELLLGLPLRALVPSLVVSGAYGLLFWINPSQLAFVLASALEQVWPFAFGLLLVSMFALCQSAMTEHKVRASLVGQVGMAAPLIVVAMGFLTVEGSRLLAAAGGVAAIATFLAATRFLSVIMTKQRAIVAGLLIFGSFAIAALASPLDFPRAIGSFAILAAFLGIAGNIFAIALSSPLISLGVVSTIVLANAFSPAPHNRHELPTTKRDVGEAGVVMMLDRWFNTRVDLEAYRDAKRPYPLIIVSSEGGGIYAAAHAYLGLSTLALNCPVFTQHVFALVGVSGGAIGNALFSASAKDAQQPYAKCAPNDATPSPKPVAADHLSPVLARFLLLESLQAVVPVNWLKLDRAAILTRSFLSVSGDPTYLEGSVSGSWNATGARPALISVATNMRNGRRLIFAPFMPTWGQSTGEWWPTDAVVHAVDLGLLEAASVSARFPWVTPTALLRSSDAVTHILADGGYFENSGAETVLDIVNEIKAIANLQQERPSDVAPGGEQACQIFVHAHFNTEATWDGCSKHVFVMHLALSSSCMMDQNQGCDPGGTGAQSFLLDPLRTLLSSRQARGALALERSRIELCGSGGGECLNPDASIGFFRSAIDPVELQVPLGWHISAAMASKLAATAIPKHAFSYLTPGNDNENDISRMIFHFDLKLYDPNNRPNIEGLLGSP